MMRPSPMRDDSIAAQPPSASCPTAASGAGAAAMIREAGISSPSLHRLGEPTVEDLNHDKLSSMTTAAFREQFLTR